MSTANNSKTIDMTHGSICDKILLFALPLAATAILQQLFNAADTAVVGNFAGKEAMAAVGSCTPVVNLLINIFIGISLGENVLLSRYIGAGKRERISDCVHTGVSFAVLGGIFMGVFGFFFAPQILFYVMKLPAEVLPLSVIYIRIYFAGLPIILLYNFLAAIFRSYGDTRTPLLALVFSGVTNVLLNLFFVIVLHMSADGVAIATVVSNLISALILIRILIKKDDEFNLDLRNLRINKSELLSMVKIGVPAGINGMVFSFSNVIIQSGINSLGADVMAGSAAAQNIEIIVYMLYNSFTQSITTFVSQNYGAQDVKRARKITRYGLLIDLGFVFCACVFCLVFRFRLVRIFVKVPQVVEMGVVRMIFSFMSMWINTINDFLSGALRGYGFSMTPAVLAASCVCGSRILGVFTLFKAFPAFTTLMSLYPISWTLHSLFLVPVYFYVVRKKVG